MAITDFHGKTAFITGGASGIGLGIAKVLVERGAQVVIADLRPDHIAHAMEQFAGEGRSNQVASVEIDVTSRQRYAEVAEQMSRDYGGIDILINNAGVGSEGPILEAGYADWDFGLGVNVNGVVNGLQAMLPQMIAHGRGGHVVNTASLAAVVQMPEYFVIYGAAKAAVLNISENMRAVLDSKNIGMSCLLPGFTKSNIHQANQNRPEHLKQGSGWAASEEKLAHRQFGDIGANWLEPEDVGVMVADAIIANELYIITHGNFRDQMQRRFDAMMARVPEADFQF
ncbi:SDR family NAD(P)-dependent oxidoreductase [Novosphingobium sp. FSY-8]|uniref:SDR family NAD(P)-dependent oxidoreductase n=1 Tax=Novosphingobium ovatum TaxID=1908523 RepID=A0ABW9XDV1_9SPHN|nr:SDR family NAD(P)-dependent oxidoreductase [Novosphingobium ovatum]NBC36719.1 SDR family NAD(P)-dependent oxidoreductase [Novosphingobium ovatum]